MVENPPVGRRTDPARGGLCMRLMRRPTLRVAGSALAMLVGLSGCTAGNISSPTLLLPKRVGDFTLQWVKGDGALRRTPSSISTGDATFTIGPGPLYLLSARMPDGRLSASESAGCPPLPVWQVDLMGPNPGMLCPYRGALVLELYNSNGPGVPLGSAGVGIMKAALSESLGPHSLGGYVVDGGVAWWLKAEGGAVLASGFVSTLDDATAKLPTGLLPSGGGVRLLSLADQLYVLRPVAAGYEVSQPDFRASRLQPLGKVPDGRVWAIDQLGGVWMTRKLGDGRIDLMRAAPGQANVRSWHAKGQLVGAGSGFLAYLAPAEGGTLLHLMFPLSHRTLVVRGLRPPFASMQEAQDGSIYLYLHLATGRRAVRIAWSPLK